ncbi:MAG TPA: glutaredoxin family protein [Thermotogota bacterium]|nr:glutaredoxin family protein [Thermotogota bacterium]HRW92962.1 glutaredoxin family protein [Thermotogota bacterium]
MHTKIVVYTTPSCPHCTSAKRFFRERGIPFKEYDVSKDQRAADMMVKKSKQMGVPVIEVGNQIVVGFDRSKLNRLLNV